MTINVTISVKAPSDKELEVVRTEGDKSEVIGTLKGMTFDEYVVYDGVELTLREKDNSETKEG